MVQKELKATTATTADQKVLLMTIEAPQATNPSSRNHHQQRVPK